VRKGQQLATLDSTFARADLAALTERYRSLQVQLRRMEAEWAGAPFVQMSVSDRDEALQAALMRQRQQQYASRLRAFDEELHRYEANAQTIDRHRDVLHQQLAVAQEIEGMRTTLLRSQAGSRMQLLQSQNLRLQAEREHRDALDRLTELQFATLSKRAERQVFIDEWRRSLLEELDRQRTEAARVKEALVKAERLHDLVVVTAPEDGVVMDIARRSAGSVLREAEPLLTLMPSNASIIAEILVSSADIGYAKSGDEVILKVDAFPYQRHGTLKGRLISIGEESFIPGQGSSDHGTGSAPRGPGGAYHRARIEIVNDRLDGVPKGVRLRAGMTLSGEIKVGTRSIISYFLHPISRGLDESIREP
jgi:hemolysin D